MSSNGQNYSNLLKNSKKLHFQMGSRISSNKRVNKFVELVKCDPKKLSGPERSAFRKILDNTSIENIEEFFEENSQDDVNRILKANNLVIDILSCYKKIENYKAFNKIKKIEKKEKKLESKINQTKAILDSFSQNKKRYESITVSLISIAKSAAETFMFSMQTLADILESIGIQYRLLSAAVVGLLPGIGMLLAGFSVGTACLVGVAGVCLCVMLVVTIPKFGNHSKPVVASSLSAILAGY